MIGSYVRGWSALMRARFNISPDSRRSLRDAALNAQIFGAWRLSERLERRAAELTARAVDELNAEALDLYDEGNYTAAVETFQEAIAENPSDYQALRGLGTSLHQLGNLADATYYYYSALNVSPDDPDVLTNLGLALSDSGRGEEAIDVLMNAADLAPHDSDLLRFLANSLLDYGRNEEAADIAHRLLAMNEDDAVAHALLGDVRNAQSDGLAAADSWRRSAEIDPTNPNVLLALSAVEEPEQAITSATRALELYREQDNVTGQVEALANVAWSQYLLGRHEEAEKTNQRALELDPGLAQVWFNLGLNRLVDGDSDGATEAYEKGLAVTGLADLKVHGIDDLEELAEHDHRPEVTELLERLSNEYGDRRMQATS